MPPSRHRALELHAARVRGQPAATPGVVRGRPSDDPQPWYDGRQPDRTPTRPRRCPRCWPFSVVTSRYVSEGDQRRTILAADLFVGPMECGLADGELAVAATFPNPPARSGSSWLEVARRHGRLRRRRGRRGRHAATRSEALRSARLALVSVARHPAGGRRDRDVRRDAIDRSTGQRRSIRSMRRSTRRPTSTPPPTTDASSPGCWPAKRLAEALAEALEGMLDGGAA